MKRAHDAKISFCPASGSIAIVSLVQSAVAMEGG